MIIFIYGEDSFRSRAYVRELTEKFKRERDPGGYNLKTLDAAVDDAGAIISELSAAPFLAEKRMVVVSNLLAKADAETIEAVTEKMQKLPSDIIAVFVETETVGKTKIAKQSFESLKKQQYAREFAPVSGSKLEGYATEYLKNKKTVAEAGVVAWLVVQLPDTWILTSTLDQLVAYAQGRSITLEDAKLFVDEKIDDNIFHLVEAVVGGVPGTAFKLLSEQRRQGEDAGRILALIAWQMRILLALADELERRPSESSDSLAKALKLNPFVVKKNMALARRVPFATLQARFTELLDIDIKTKTGAGNPELLLDLFVARV